MQKPNGARKVIKLSLILIGFVFLLISVAFRSFVDEESAELRSVIVKAKIIDEQRYRSNSELTIRFKYNGVYYTSALQANGQVFKLNDSVAIRIDSRSPSEYCEFAD